MQCALSTLNVEASTSAFASFHRLLPDLQPRRAFFDVFSGPGLTCLINICRRIGGLQSGTVNLSLTRIGKRRACLSSYRHVLGPERYIYVPLPFSVRSSSVRSSCLISFSRPPAPAPAALPRPLPLLPNAHSLLRPPAPRRPRGPRRRSQPARQHPCQVRAGVQVLPGHRCCMSSRVLTSLSPSSLVCGVLDGAEMSGCYDGLYVGIFASENGMLTLVRGRSVHAYRRTRLVRVREMHELGHDGHRRAGAARQYVCVPSSPLYRIPSLRLTHVIVRLRPRMPETRDLPPRARLTGATEQPHQHAPAG